MSPDRKENTREVRPPIVVFNSRGGKGFFRLEEAYSYLEEGQSEYQDVFLRPELDELRVWVEGDFKGPQRVILETPHKRGVVDRSSSIHSDSEKGFGIDNPGLGVSADPLHPDRPVPCESINIHVNAAYDPDLGGVVASHDDPEINRNLAWVLFKNPQNPQIHFEIKPQALDHQKIAGIFGRVKRRVMTVLTDALNGNNPL